MSRPMPLLIGLVAGLGVGTGTFVGLAATNPHNHWLAGGSVLMFVLLLVIAALASALAEEP